MEQAQAAGPHKATPVEVVRGVDAVELARAALASCCDQIRLNVAGARRGEDPAYTHQLRVGTRRLRVALSLFSALLDAAEVASLVGELKWVFSRLGAQRDLDVLLSELLAPLAAQAETAALVALRTAIEQERARRRQTVQQTLASKRFAQLLRALDALQTEIAERAELGKSARKLARRKLSRRSEHVLARLPAALGDDPHQRHELRKELKKLRYASELCGPLFKPKRVKRFLAQLEEVQDVMGDLNDVASGRAQLAQVATGRHIELGSALEACEAELARREAALLEQLAPVIAKQRESTPFWL